MMKSTASMTFIKRWLSSMLTMLCLLAVNAQAQSNLSVQQTEMAKLDFLVGHWAGEGKSYDGDGESSTYYDTEDVWFDVQGGVLVIQARGFKEGEQFYGIHTLIYYDEEAKHYWYNPYTDKGARRFACELKDKQFVCFTEDKSFRLTFRRTSTGQWNEFGERLVNGQWIKTFETRLDSEDG